MDIEQMLERTAKVTGLDVDDLESDLTLWLIENDLPPTKAAAYLKQLQQSASGNGGRGRSGHVAAGMDDDRGRPGRQQRRAKVEQLDPEVVARRKLEMIAAISVVLLVLWASQFLWR